MSGILAVIPSLLSGQALSAAKDLGVRRARPFAALRVTGLRSLVSCDTIMYKTVQSFFRLSKEPILERLTTHLTLAPGASIDLHMHTNYSDGRWPTQQLIDFLVAEGFDLVAVTDHDRVPAISRAATPARACRGRDEHGMERQNGPCPVLWL